MHAEGASRHKIYERQGGVPDLRGLQEDGIYPACNMINSSVHALGYICFFLLTLPIRPYAWVCLEFRLEQRVCTNSAKGKGLKLFYTYGNGAMIHM